MPRIYGVTARRIAGGGGGATRVLASDEKAVVKIETSPVTRGIVGNTQKLGHTHPGLVCRQRLLMGRKTGHHGAGGRGKRAHQAPTMAPWPPVLSVHSPPAVPTTINGVSIPGTCRLDT